MNIQFVSLFDGTQIWNPIRKEYKVRKRRRTTGWISILVYSTAQDTILTVVATSVLEPSIPTFLAITPYISARLSDHMVVILPDKYLKITKTLELDGFKKQELQIFVEFWYLGSCRSSQSQPKRKRKTLPPTALELRLLAISFLCLTGLRQQH